MNAPAAINRASRIPATSEIIQCRLSVRLFDPTPFCAAPRPNQKRSLSTAVNPSSARLRGSMLTTAMNLPARRAPSPQLRARDTSLDGTTNGSAGVNSAPDVDARVNGATHLSRQRYRDHEDRGDRNNYRKLAEHKIATCLAPFQQPPRLALGNSFHRSNNLSAYSQCPPSS